MTITANARIAGVTLWVYFVAGIGGLVLGRGHATHLLSMVTSFCALVLGVTLYAITRGQDRDLALMGMMCRVIEAVPGEGAIYFAVGSLLFSWLLLKGQMIPAMLARLGVVASGFLVVIIPLQRMVQSGGGPNWASLATWFMWLPMLVFELTLAVWFIVKGVAAPQQRVAA
jgi:hypothetical protein